MRVSECFQLGKSQPELDFVDVEVGVDNFLFIDPFAISQRPDPWSQDAHQIIVDFFQRVVTLIRANDRVGALEALSHLREPNETRLGYSRGVHKVRVLGISKPMIYWMRFHDHRLSGLAP